MINTTIHEKNDEKDGKKNDKKDEKQAAHKCIMFYIQPSPTEEAAPQTPTTTPTRVSPSPLSPTLSFGSISPMPPLPPLSDEEP